MPFFVERNDLAHIKVDAVVVAANERLKITGGVGAAVAEAAGFEQVQAACDAIGSCRTGHAVATPGFNLPAKTIVHAVGPVWQGGTANEQELLFSTYMNALSCAVTDAGAKSVALPLISAGTYGFPQKLALSVANNAIETFLDKHEDVEIRLVLYNKESVTEGLKAFSDLAEYIDDHYVDTRARSRLSKSMRFPGSVEGESVFLSEPEEAYRDYSLNMPEELLGYPQPEPSQPRMYQETRSASGSARPDSVQDKASKRSAMPSPVSTLGDGARNIATRIKELLAGSSREQKAPSSYAPKEAAEKYSWEPQADFGAPVSGAKKAPGSVREPSNLAALLDSLDEPFSTTLIALIDARGLTDAQVYKRANMSRQLFSKIRSDEGYRPTKKTALALAVALELNLEETEDLLQRAGYALSSSSKADVIVEYFILKGNYDIFEINEALYAFDQPLLF